MSSSNNSARLDSNSSVLSRAWSGLFLLSVAGLAAVSIAMVVVSVRNGTELNHVAGSWIGLAMDLSHGVFYRPLVSTEMGLGGTRFFPLFFTLHALLINLIDSPILAGHVVSLASGALLFSCCYALMRRLGTSPLMAVALLVMLSSTSSVQLGLCTIRGDILPIALSIAGLVVFLSSDRASARIAAASACFVLAFSAKITAVNGLLALLLFLFLKKRHREAGQLVLYTAAGFALVLCVMYLGSSGRVISIFRECSGGGATPYTIMKSPVELSRALADRDPLCMLLFFWASAAAVRHGRDRTNGLPVVFLVATTVVTLFIYGSPGTIHNHLVDLATASTILIGSTEFAGRSAKTRAAASVYLILAALWLPYGLQTLKWLLVDHNVALTERLPREVVEVFERNDAPVLSEDPMLAIAAHQSPYLLDAFMLRLLLQDAEFRSSLLEDIRELRFAAVIFYKDPLAESDWYEQWHFGHAFVDAVLENYEECARKRRYIVYRPK